MTPDTERDRASTDPASLRSRSVDSLRDSPTVSAPRTEAGRRLLDAFGGTETKRMILAIEAEAAQPIDANILARAIAAVSPTGTKYPDRLAAEYARLSGEEGS